MKEIIKLGIGYLSVLMLILICGYTIYFRFTHITLTETQLFLEMWWVFIPIVVLLLIYKQSLK